MRRPSLPYYYRSGEEIRKGDRVLIHGEPGQIEFVADRLTVDPELDWFVNGEGGGVMILEPKAFGRVFLHQTRDVEDLLFVSRASD